MKLPYAAEHHFKVTITFPKFSITLPIFFEEIVRHGMSMDNQVFIQSYF